jgi:predicted acyltransferase
MGVSTAQHLTEAAAPNSAAPATESQQPLAGRLMSLDIFRGITIAGMILVNNAGDGEAAYWPLKHSHWNGWTPTDLVFPFFLFIVGVSMVYSFASRLKRGESRAHLILHVVKRSAILFAIGVFIVNSFPNRYDLHHIRIEGVLQRIAVCYLICSVLVLWTGTRTQLAAIPICLVGYWVLMRFVSVPGFGVPTHDIPLLDPDRNLAAWLDRKLLFGHLYEGTRDPEGVLSTIPALGTTLIGVLTGEWLRSSASAKRKAAWMLGMGVAGLAAGKFFNLWFPINKKLWTSSYVLFVGGFALVCLAVCYWLLDVKQKRGRWTVPIIVFGSNAIAAYTFSEALANVLEAYHVQLASGGVLTWQELIYQRVFAPLASPANSSLLYSLAYVLVCWLFTWLLYRKRIFIKV